MAAIGILRSSRVSLTRQSFKTFRIGAMETRRNLSSYVVTPKELDEALRKCPPSPINSDPRVVPLCAAWFLPNDPRKGIDVFRQQRIPRARFFDLDKVIDKHSPYPHMLPSARLFAEAMGELGIRKDDTVVVYDTKELGIFSAPRVAWTLRVFGHPKVHILDNFKVWVEEEYPTESGELYSVDCNPYPIPEMAEEKVASFEEIKEVAQDANKEGAEGIQILDARPSGRFAGKDPEPREGLPSGHMPGAMNIPFSAVLDPETKTFLPKDKLKKLFAERGVDPSKPIVTSCGTGVTAVVLETALEVAGYGSPEKRRVYDGGWTEWAQRVQQSENLILKDE
ncbi:hypothetical protein DL764_006409 [Monosporascus ibericus]|uniref:Rhodanese domain-containing protein n=1 Tax=Monosporascus ibericus TaxID=155417 RepID=A0A4Q4T8J8_9PEZI|nr:hypothetical protein DL764_006409 [Monosporascus ibericus]